jgi:hypothetical protein
VPTPSKANGALILEMPLFKGITQHQNVQLIFILFFHFFPMIHTGNQGREMIKKRRVSILKSETLALANSKQNIKIHFKMYP